MLATTSDVIIMHDSLSRTNNDNNHERYQEYHTMLATNDATTMNDAATMHDSLSRIDNDSNHERC